VDAGTGWIQDATLTIAGASLTGTIPGLPCDLDDGDLVVGNHPPTMIPVPLVAHEPVRIRLLFLSGDEVAIGGVGAWVELHSDRVR
jgi:hypothetical protein